MKFLYYETKFKIKKIFWVGAAGARLSNFFYKESKSTNLKKKCFFFFFYFFFFLGGGGGGGEGGLGEGAKFKIFLNKNPNRKWLVGCIVVLRPR